jgi:hypothetical protein
MTKAKNVRELLLALGIGQWNATMIVPYMFIAPATTDPKASQIILLVQHLQHVLYQMGATDVPISGRLDEPTARALERAVGPDWERKTWSANVSTVLTARDSGLSLRAPPSPSRVTQGTRVAVGGPLDFLPDVPGGLVTYAAGAYLLYRHLRKART